ncbi:MAG: hypothetical protein HZB92_06190 [Euryarchaeota archaeon]|nr:hypothetical protein [Euryarchaeota archaeon]
MMKKVEKKNNMMGKVYNILFYNGDGIVPTYYVIDSVDGIAIKDGNKNKLINIVQKVREIFHLGDDFPDNRIYESLFILEENGIIPVETFHNTC